MNKPLVYGVAAAAGLVVFFVWKKTASATGKSVRNAPLASGDTAITNGIATGGRVQPSEVPFQSNVMAVVTTALVKQEQLNMAKYNTQKVPEPSPPPAPDPSRYLKIGAQALYDKQVEAARADARARDKITSEAALANARQAYKDFSFEG